LIARAVRESKKGRTTTSRKTKGRSATMAKGKVGTKDQLVHITLGNPEFECYEYGRPSHFNS